MLGGSKMTFWTGEQVMETLLGCPDWADKSTELKRWCLCPAEYGFESQSWHLCPWARHSTISFSPPRCKWVPVRAEMVYLNDKHGTRYLAAPAVYSPGSWDGLRNDLGPVTRGNNVEAPWASLRGGPVTWALYKKPLLLFLLLLLYQVHSNNGDYTLPVFSIMI